MVKANKIPCAWNNCAYYFCLGRFIGGSIFLLSNSKMQQILEKICFYSSFFPLQSKQNLKRSRILCRIFEFLQMDPKTNRYSLRINKNIAVMIIIYLLIQLIIKYIQIKIIFFPFILNRYRNYFETPVKVFNAH